MNMQTTIDPFTFQLLNNTLTVFKKQVTLPVLVSDGFIPSYEDLKIHQTSMLEYFDVEIAEMLKSELELNDIQVQIFKNFLEEGTFFNN